METEAGSGGGGRNGGSRDNSPPSRGGNRNEEGPEDSDDGGNDDNHNYVAVSALLGSINLLEVDDLKMEQYPSESLEILEEINDREELMKKLDDKKLLAYYEKMFKKQV